MQAAFAGLGEMPGAVVPLNLASLSLPGSDGVYNGLTDLGGFIRRDIGVHWQAQHFRGRKVAMRQQGLGIGHRRLPV